MGVAAAAMHVGASTAADGAEDVGCSCNGCSGGNHTRRCRFGSTCCHRHIRRRGVRGAGRCRRCRGLSAEDYVEVEDALAAPRAWAAAVFVLREQRLVRLDVALRRLGLLAHHAVVDLKKSEERIRSRDIGAETRLPQSES